MSSQEPEEPQQPQRNKRRLWPWAVGVVLIVLSEWRELVSAQAQLTPGAILVVDFEAGTDGNGALFQINLSTGARTLLSDFGDGAQGPTGASPFGLVVKDRNSVLVIDNQGKSGNGTLFQVNPVNGVRKVVSDFGNILQGPLGVDPVGITLMADKAFVTDIDAGTGGSGALFSVNLTTGRRTLVSDFGSATQGPTGRTPTGIGRGTAGVLLVVDPDAGTEQKGAIFSINSTTGVRILVSDFGDPAQGPTGVNPGGVTLGASGVILVADTEAGAGGSGTLFSVNPSTGMRTILSNFGNMAQGALGKDPFFVTLATTGAILVTDDDAGTDIPLDGHIGGNGALFSLNPVTGNRTLLSDFGNATQGPTGVEPAGIAIVPLTQRDEVLVIESGPVASGGTLVSVDLATGTRTLVSDFDNPTQGPGGVDPVDVAIGTAGDILVVDYNVGGFGALFSVNPTNGARTVLSNFGNAMQGPVGGQPEGVTLGRDGDILVVTLHGGTGNKAALFRVHPTTGVRTLMSDFGNGAQGPLGFAPVGVTLGRTQDILVVDADAISPVGGVATGMLFRVNPTTGMRTIVSDFGARTQGPIGGNPWAVTLGPGNTLLVSDLSGSPTAGSRGALFRISPIDGVRAILSDFANPMQGPVGPYPAGVILGAAGSVLVIDGGAGTGTRGALFRVDPTTGVRTVLSDFGNAQQGPLGANAQDAAVLAVCGDGVLSGGEECDDSNTADGDGCSAICVFENVHDLAVTNIGAPRTVTITNSNPVPTALITVQLQNRSPLPEIIVNADQLRSLVSLTVDSLGGCGDRTPIFYSPPAQTFPLTLKPKDEYNLAFAVTFDCVNDPAQSRGLAHDDYRYEASVNHAVLGAPDTHLADDHCPRNVTPPYAIDSNPDGTIQDQGCGAKNSDGTFGAEMLTDVIVLGKTGQIRIR